MNMRVVVLGKEFHMSLDGRTFCGRTVPEDKSSFEFEPGCDFGVHEKDCAECLAKAKQKGLV